MLLVVVVVVVVVSSGGAPAGAPPLCVIRLNSHVSGVETEQCGRVAVPTVAACPLL